MIRKVQIKNYFQLHQLEQELGSINLLHGKNGTGKTTFCDALFFVSNGFSQLHADLNKIKNQNRFTQVVCQLDTTKDRNSTIKLHLERNKRFFCGNQTVNPAKYLGMVACFFVSSQTLAFNKFHQQSRFFTQHIVNYDSHYHKTVQFINQQFRLWLQARTTAPAPDQLLEIEKTLTKNLHLIWEEHNRFITEINKNILYLIQQFFPQFPRFFIRLVSWLKKTDQKTVVNLQSMIMDFWNQKRKDDRFRFFNQIPLVNDFVGFEFVKGAHFVNLSATNKHLMKLILNFAIAYFVKHQNKPVIFLLDGFDFLDETNRYQVLKMLAYFDQVVVSTTHPTLWPLQKFWNTQPTMIAFPGKRN